MPYASLLGLREPLGRLRLLLVVVGLELGIVDVHFGGEVGEAHLDIAQVHRFRRHVLRFVRVVIRLDRRIVGRGLGRKLGRRNSEPGNLALLASEGTEPRQLGRRDEARGAECALQLTQLRIVTDHVLDLPDRPALGLEHRQRVGEIPFAVHLQLRDAGHLREKLLIAHAIAELVGTADQGLGVHVLLEHAALEVRALGVAQLTIGLTLVLGELLLIRLANVVAGDLHAVHFGSVVGRAHRPVDAPKNENEADDAEHHSGQPTLQLVMNCLQHALLLIERDPGERGRRTWLPQGNGGVDGTRTRDPRRDRPVF